MREGTKQKMLLVGKLLLGIIGIVALALLIYGCVEGIISNEKNRISEGTVIDKKYSPSYSYVTYTLVGNNRIPEVHYVPESYRMEIRGQKDEVTVDYWFSCTELEYETYHIGDYYRK